MKRFFAFALLLTAFFGMLAGCRSKNSNNTTPTTSAHTETAKIPNNEDMLPGPEDTISDNNGANQNEDTIGESEGANITADTTPSENSNSRIRPRTRPIPGT